MCAVGPMNFQKDAFGTYEISNFMNIVTSFLIDMHPSNGSKSVWVYGKSDIYIDSNTSSSLAQLDVGMQIGIYQTGCKNNLCVNKNN